MKPNRRSPLVLIAATVLGLCGCGPSAAERAADEQKRLALEQQAQQDAQKANAAITQTNQKLGRKSPALDLGLPAGSQTPSEKKQP